MNVYKTKVMFDIVHSVVSVETSDTLEMVHNTL